MITLFTLFIVNDENIRESVFIAIRHIKERNKKFIGMTNLNKREGTLKSGQVYAWLGLVAVGPAGIEGSR